MQQGASDSTVRSLSRMEGPFADFHLAINYGIAECFLFKTSITRKLTGSRAPAVWPGNMISVLCNNNHRDASPFSQFYVFCAWTGPPTPRFRVGMGVESSDNPPPRSLRWISYIKRCGFAWLSAENLLLQFLCFDISNLLPRGVRKNYLGTSRPMYL